MLKYLFSFFKQTYIGGILRDHARIVLITFTHGIWDALTSMVKKKALVEIILIAEVLGWVESHHLVFESDAMKVTNGS